MSDKTREVYKELAYVISELNPIVEMPKMRLSEVNKLNALIKRATPKPIVKDGYDEWDENEKKFACPICKSRVYEDYNCCPYCTQRLDVNNYAL